MSGARDALGAAVARWNRLRARVGRSVWIRLPQPVQRLLLATVWAPGALREEDQRIRHLLRVFLPLTDLGYIYFGVVGAVNGLASVERATSGQWQRGWSIVLAVSGLMALIGVAFPRLVSLEMVGKALMIGGISTYLSIMVIRGASEANVTAIAGLLFGLVYLPMWRIGDLGTRKAKDGRGSTE